MEFAVHNPVINNRYATTQKHLPRNNISYYSSHP